MLPVSDLFAYTEWGNAAILSAATERPVADWTHDLGGSFPTLQKVLAHSAGGEWVWLSQ